MEALRVLSTSQRIFGYAAHTHPYWEIILYLEGEGEFRFQRTRAKIQPETVIIVPPGVEHSSVSADGYWNIAVVGDFYRYFLTDEPLILHRTGEARTLALLLWQNPMTFWLWSTAKPSSPKVLL